MTKPSNDDQRLETGIPGLDRLLGGGLPRGGLYTVQGPPGAGKTVLASQMCFHVARRGGRAAYVTLLSESSTRLFSQLETLAFFRGEAVGRGVQYTSAYSVLERDGLPGLLRLVRELVTTQPARLLVLDGLASALDTAQAGREYRRFLHELSTIAGMTACTVLLLVSGVDGPGLRAEHTMVDGLIELSNGARRLRSLRKLEIMKLRGTEVVRGQHTFTIDASGVAVRARIEADVLRLPEDALLMPSTERLATGVTELDAMLHGGLPRRSSTMTLGPSGSGKTMLGLQFLAAGAERGEPGLFFGFFERPQTLLAKGARVGMPLEAAVRDGRVQLLWEPYGETAIDALAERLFDAVRARRPRRVFLDGLQGFQVAAEEPERVSSVFSAISEELELLDVTMMFTAEVPVLVGGAIEAPLRGISAVTHNILLLRYVEFDARLRKVLSVLKVRDSGYDHGLRELVIDEGGCRLLESFRDAHGVLGGQGLRAAPAPSPVRAGAPARARRVRRDAPAILIADDEFALAELMAEMLEDKGYHTEIALNGDLALRAMRERPPDLVLLDAMMPVLSGTELVRQMEASPTLSNIPVVLMTALPRNLTSEERGVRCRAVLHKPFAPEALFDVVEHALGGADERSP